MTRLEITLHDIFWSLKRHILWIIAATFIFSIGAWVYTENFITPIYSTNVSLCMFSSTRQDGQVTNSQLYTDAILANTGAYILSRQEVAQAVTERLNYTIAPLTVQSMITAVAIDETQLIYVTITSTDPDCAIQVANALCDVAPEVVPEMLKSGELTVVDRALYAAQVSPNLTSNISLGFFIGLLLSCAIVILIAVLDTTMWRQEDLERSFTIPVLGSVPSMTGLAAHGSTHKKTR